MTRLLLILALNTAALWIVATVVSRRIAQLEAQTQAIWALLRERLPR
jgi:hypothetical protein